jgi:UDP-N-acetylmuramate dehydrogenase
VKSSAAWLIEHAGFAKGYGNERVSLSTKHTLALTNRGGATTSRPAGAGPRGPRRRRGGVRRRLVNEPVLVGVRPLITVATG